MAGMNESCSVCSKTFDVQFRYQMEERDDGFLFFCSQTCHGKSVRGELAGGVNCDACAKRFMPELVSQVVRGQGGARKYACSAECRAQVLAEADGLRLAQLLAPDSRVPETLPVPSGPLGRPSEIAEKTAASSAPVSVPRLQPLRTIGNMLPNAAPSISPVVTVVAPSPAPAGVAPAPRGNVLNVTSVTNVTPVAPMVAPVPARPLAPFAGPRKLAIFNHKGGTGKTTTTVSIAAGLAEKGLRVLLVDTDSQGNVAVSFGVKPEKTLYHVLVMGLKPEDAAIEVRPNLHLLASNETLAAAELYLAGRQNRDRVLRDRLAATAASYDVVVIDCSPSLSLMNQNALVLADGILVPVACDFLSLVGVRQVIKTVKNVNSLLRHPVQIYGVLPTFYDARARICRDAVDTLKQHFGDKCLAPIRAATRIKEAPAQSKTIFELAPDSTSAEDYRAVVDRLVTGRFVELPEELSNKSLAESA